MSRRLLLSLGLIGATFTGHTPDLFPTTQEAPAPAEELREAHATSWIPGLGFSEPSSAPGLSTAEAESAVVRLVTLRPDEAFGYLPGVSEHEKASGPLPPDQPSTLPESVGNNDDVVWVQVLRAARVHSGPSVSAPTVRFYRVGTGLHLIDYERGWFQISDPATAQRGWIYEKYLGAVSAPLQLQAAAEESQSSTPVEFQSPRPRQPLVRAKVRRLPARERNQRQSAERIAASVQTEKVAPPVEDESVARLLEKALRGY